MVSLEARTVFHWTPLTSSVYVQYVTCYSKLPFSTGKLKPVMNIKNHLTARPMYFPRLRDDVAKVMAEQSSSLPFSSPSWLHSSLLSSHS